jgi:hypothetical protein
MRLAALALLVPLALAAMPPGSEDEIYCPARMCLRERVDLRCKRTTGPRSKSLECFDPEKGDTVRPRVWGAALDTTLRTSLLSEEWHTERCTRQDLVGADMLLRFELLYSRLDSVIGKLAFL